MSKLKTCIVKSNYSFSKKLYKALIVPAVVAVLALVFMFAFGFNKGMEFKGGVIASVMSQTTDFEDFGGYNQLKADVDVVLEENNVRGNIYSIENDLTTYNKVFVVKIAYNSNEANEQALVDGIKEGLINKFYSETSAEEIENRNLVVVSTFEGQVSSWTIVSSILATFVTTLAICLYMAFRMGLHASVLGLLASIYNNVLVFALIMVTRVQLGLFTLSLLPFVSILSLLYVFLFERRAKRLEKTNEKYVKLSNYELVDDAILHGFDKYLFITCFAVASLVVLSLFNIMNPVFNLCLAYIEAILVIVFTGLYVTPSLFALTYVRKYKKNKE